MAAPIDPVSATQGTQSSGAPAPFNAGDPSAPVSPADIKASTLGELAATPAGQEFLKVLTDALEIQAYNDMKRHQQRAIEAAKEARRNAQG